MDARNLSRVTFLSGDGNWFHHRRGSGVAARTLNRTMHRDGLDGQSAAQHVRIVASWLHRSVEVKIDGVVLSVSVEELGAFVRSPTADPAQLSRSELSTWMGLLAPAVSYTHLTLPTIRTV